ncbi:MAG: hypothetical protein AAF527_12625 [Pseudomonadota bacterium]
MKRVLAAGAAWMLAFGPAAAEPVTVREVLEARMSAASGAFGARAEWGALVFYLQGVIEGVAAAQLQAKDIEAEPIFCPPPGKGYSIEEAVALLEAAAEDNDNQPAAAALLKGYAKALPCKA